MSLEELTTQVNDLTKLNEKLQEKLDNALERLKGYEDEEIVTVKESIQEKTEGLEDKALEGKSLDELKAMDSVLTLAKVGFKGVASGSDEDDPEKKKAGDLTVGRYDPIKQEWVT